MGKKNRKKRIGVVYSTNPDYTYQTTDDQPEKESPDPKDQVLRVQLDRKGRKGKEVTLVTGFQGPDDELGALGKRLKKACGVGGSVKDGEILIQGDHRDRVVEILRGEGFTNTKRSGG